MTIAGNIAQALTALKAMGLVDRSLANNILEQFLVRHPEVLTAWCVWEPNAFDGCDHAFAGAPGHDGTGRFVPLWHRYGGTIQLEANTNYDRADTGHWYLVPSRRAEEMVIDPYEYPIAGRPLFITTQVAPIFHAGKCVGAAGIDILLDSLCTQSSEKSDPPVAQLEASLQRGHVLIEPSGEVRSCSGYARMLLSRFAGMRLLRNRRLPKILREGFDQCARQSGRSFHGAARIYEQRLPAGEHTLSLRYTRDPLSNCVVLVVELKKEGRSQPLPEINLSAREFEVLSWLSCGKSNEEIGVILGASAHTIKHHVEHILAKLGVENRYAAALIYHEATRNPSEPANRITTKPASSVSHHQT